MKLIRQTIVWTIVTFIGLTLLTMKEQAAVDGINAYGFPWTFYSSIDIRPVLVSGDYGFKMISLLADTGLIAVIVFITIILKNKIFKTSSRTPV